MGEVIERFTVKPVCKFGLREKHVNLKETNT